MHFCPNCGERLPEGAGVCPNCGAGLGPAPVQRGKKPAGRRRVWIAAACAAVLAALAAVLAPRFLTSPRDQFLARQKLLLDGALKAVTAVSEAYNGCTELSTDTLLTAACGSAQARAVLRESSLGLKVDLKRNSLLLNGTLTVMGSPVLAGALTYESGTVGVCLPEADPHYYVADLRALAERQGWAGLDGVAGAELPQIPAQALTGLARTYFDVLSTAVTEDNVKRSGGQVRLEQLDETQRGVRCVFTPKAGDIEEMLLKLAGQLEEDRELRELAAGLVGGNARLLRDLTGLDPDNLDPALNALAGYLRSNAGSLGRALEDAGFTWTLGFSQDRGLLEKLELDGGERALVCEAVEGRIALYTRDPDDSRVFRCELEYRENDGLLEGNLICARAGGTASLRFEGLDPDERSILGLPRGAWTLEARDGSYGLEVKAAEGGGTDHILSLPDPGPVHGVNLGRLKITLHTTDEASTAVPPDGKIVNISGYSQNELRSLIYRMGLRLSGAMVRLVPSLLRR